VHPLVLGAMGGAGLATGLYLGWREGLGRPPADLPAVLAYHKIGTPELGGTWCTRRQFAAHLDGLQRAGFTALDLAAFEARVAACRGLALGADAAAAAAGREILVTFDDGFASFAAHAWPELQARRMPVVLFVVSEFVGRTSSWDLPLAGRRVAHLDWPELRRLVHAGVVVGSHAATHRDLRRLTAAELARELRGSRQRLEDELGVAVHAVSYPFGRQDARVCAAAAAAGYRLGFSMCPRGPNARVDRLALRRWGVYAVDGRRAVLDKVDARRRGFWVQDVATRLINACAGLAASRRR
jgi:peptidoglycan/xylan/chitin deacetylase (PgdA/CDA1 family)